MGLMANLIQMNVGGAKVTSQEGYIVKTYSGLPSGILDFCFDGDSFFFLTLTQILQYRIDQGSLVQIRAVSHGISNPAGITFNGEGFLVLA